MSKSISGLRELSVRAGSVLQVVIRFCERDARLSLCDDLESIPANAVQGEVASLGQANLALLLCGLPEAKPRDIPFQPRLDKDGRELDVPAQREGAPVEKEQPEDEELEVAAALKLSLEGIDDGSEQGGARWRRFQRAQQEIGHGPQSKCDVDGQEPRSRFLVYVTDAV